MISNLNDGKLDVIVALTEGLVKEMASGADIRLLGTYVRSPLCWAVSTGAESKFNEVSDLKGETFGISRFTSGSHLMSFVLAQQHGWSTSSSSSSPSSAHSGDVSFSVQGNFKNLRDGVNSGESAAFLWETFTTKPFHDSGEIRRIGEISTPWAPFMVATTSGFAKSHPDTLRAMMAAVREACSLFADPKNADEMIQSVSNTYSLPLTDVREWYRDVEVVGEPSVRRSDLEKAVEVLTSVGVLPAFSAPSSATNTATDIDSFVFSPVCPLLDEVPSHKKRKPSTELDADEPVYTEAVVAEPESATADMQLEENRQRYLADLIGWFGPSQPQPL